MDDRQPILGTTEIADLLEVAKETPARWNTRGVLPPPVCKVSGYIPVWYRHDILVWAHRTNRLPTSRIDELPEPLRGQAIARREAAQAPPGAPESVPATN